MIYRLLKLLFRFTLNLYFKDIQVLSKQKLFAEGPVVFVSNHQSAFMDALLLGMLIDRPLHFMSRGESFDKGWKRWLFRQFNMHPIYRKAFSPGAVKDNPALLQSYGNTILAGSAFLVFPEGISKTEPRLRPINKGVARMILESLSADQWNKEVQVIPIGIHYENPHRFRSSCVLSVGEAISAQSFESIYQQSAAKAVKKMRDQIQVALERLTVFIPIEHHESTVDKVSNWYYDHYNAVRLNAAERFQIRRKVARIVRFYDLEFPELLDLFKMKLHAFEQIEKQNKLTNHVQPIGKLDRIWGLMKLITCLPIFLYSLVNHMLILGLSDYLAKHKCPRPDFYGSVLLAGASFGAVPIYAFQTIAVYLFTGSLMISMLYLCTLPLAAKLGIWYYELYTDYNEKLQLHLPTHIHGRTIKHLERKKSQINMIIDEAYEVYLRTIRKRQLGKQILG